MSVENVSKRFGERLLFDQITFGVSKGEKVALIAKNGTGKTSLLRILSGSDKADSGLVTFRNDLSVGYLSQEPTFDLNHTVNEAIFVADNPLVKAVKDYELSIEKEDTDAMQKAFAEMERLNAWDYESNIKQILGKLRITRLTQKLSEMSGGQKRRIALAKLLIEEPDFLILDEPTNHLDLDMIEWLEKYLSQSHKTIFMVTHDRYFLDNVCDVIYELDDQSLFRYKGNYSYYVEKKSERVETQKTELEKAKNLFKKELEWMRKTPQARTTKSKSRIDAFYDVKSKAKKKKDDTELELNVNMERLGNKTVELHHVSKGYDDGLLFKEFHYKFLKGEKVGIIGNNGSGKSTLLNLITKLEEPNSGKVIWGETLKLGYYAQQGIEFAPDKKVIEIITDIAEHIPGPKGRTITAAQMLERFLFTRDQHYQFVSKLSGGEKRRLYLLTILMDNPNFLILDEPTNDLDILTLNVLEAFLQDYQGCLLVVTHDRYFMDKLVDHIFILEGEGKWRDFVGNYSDYRSGLKAEAKKAEMEKTKKISKPKIERQADRKQKLSFHEKREFEQLENEIPKLEEKKAILQAKLESGALSHEDLVKVSREFEEVSDAIDEKEMRWLELSELDNG